MKYEDIKEGMSVADGYNRGTVKKVYKKTVHVLWHYATNPYNNGDKWIYDLDHLQFLSEVKQT